MTLVVPRVRAWELLNTPDYCGRLTMLKFHELLLEAGYSAEAAREAARQRGWDRMCAGLVQ